MRDLPKLCLFVLVGACGGGGNKLPDGAPGADGPPGQPDSAPPSTMTIHVSQVEGEPSPGAAIEGADVAVLDPGSTAPRMFATDPAGAVTFPVEAGARVWVARDELSGGKGPPAQLYLIESVSPGDDIHLGALLPPPGTSAAGTLTINYPLYAGSGYIYTHDSYVTYCTDGGFDPAPGTLVFMTYEGCDAPSRSLVITAHDPDTGANVAYLTVPNVSPVPGTIDATTATWDAAGVSYSATQEGLPASVYYAYTSLVSETSWHDISVSGPIADGAGSYGMPGPVMPTPALILTELDSTGMPQYVADPATTALPADLAVDATSLLPFLDSPSFDDATRTISWDEVAAGTLAPQVVSASFNYFNAEDSSQYRWTIYAPGTTTELVIPDVPDELTSHDLLPGDTVFPDLWLFHVIGSNYSDDLANLDAYRNNIQSGGLRPGVRTLASGGFGGGKGLAPRRHR